jgi:serine/threonine protein kinase
MLIDNRDASRSAIEARGSPSPQDVAPAGDTGPPQQIGDYRVLRRIHTGAVTEVYEGLATTPPGPDRTGRRVALTVLQKELAQDGQTATRFLTAAGAAMEVHHPALVVPLHCKTLPDGTPYVVTDFIEGTSLRRLLKRRMPVPLAVTVGRRLAQGLAAAHQAGVVHRDLKPENILFVPPARVRPRVGQQDLDTGVGIPRILNLGAARLSAELRASRASVPPIPTLSALHRGSAPHRYLAPEQWRGATDITDRADVYALGAILFEMLGGAPPFAAASTSEVMALHLLKTPPPLRERRREVPAVLADLVHRMLAKDAQERPSMTEVQGTLATLGDLQEQQQKKRLRVVLVVALAALVLCLVLILTVLR